MTSAKPRLVLCSKDSIFTHDFLKELTASKQVDIIATISSKRIKKRNEIPLLSSLDIARQCGLSYALFLLRITQPGLLPGHEGKWQKLKAWSQKLQIPHFATADINSPAMVQTIQTLKPDYVISLHFNQIFSKSTLQSFDCPIINIHPGQLPRYRGLDPTFYAMLNKDDSLSVSIHHVDETIDTGPLLAQAHFPNKDLSLLQATRLAFKKGAGLLLDHLAGKTLPQKTQGSANYYSWPDKKAVADFKKDNTFI